VPDHWIAGERFSPVQPKPPKTERIGMVVPSAKASLVTRSVAGAGEPPAPVGTYATESAVAAAAAERAVVSEGQGAVLWAHAASASGARRERRFMASE
jgi:hypothetical protein